MKKSNYNIIIRRKNASLIYNSFTNTYVALSNKVCDAFESLDIEQFKEKFDMSFKKMCEFGIIIPDNRDELALIRYKNKKAVFGSRELSMVIYPTQDCNLKCWYCYENHVPNTRMSQEVISRIKKYVMKSLAKNAFDAYSVTLFGGEPFIDFDNIAYPLLTELKDIVEKAGKKFTCFFVTNASLINDKIINKLKKLRPHFQITLDGDKNHHNKVRIWKRNNKPTFDHILLVIHKLCDEFNGEKFFLTLRINYDNNALEGLLNVLDRIKDLDRKKIFIHFERVWQTEKESTDESKSKFRDVLFQYIKEGFCVNQGTFRGFPYSCPSDLMNTIVINYDGSVHKCNGRTLSKATQYGKLKSDGTIDINMDLLSKRLAVATLEHQQCLTCKMLPVCMGPCSQKLLENNGKWSKNICSMGSIDTSLSDYLLMDFSVKLLVQKYNE